VYLLPAFSFSIIIDSRVKIIDQFSLGFVHFLLLAVASDKVYQLLAHGRWFSPASSITKTGRNDIAEILLKVALKHQKSNIFYFMRMQQIENLQ
jgi:hypothetical protein